MTRSKVAPAAVPGETEGLVAAVERLTAEMRVLRQVLDEIREDLQYALRNCTGANHDRPPFRHITSMPIDPCADDFAAQLNKYTPAELPPENSHPPQRCQTSQRRFGF